MHCGLSAFFSGLSLSLFVTRFVVVEETLPEAEVYTVLSVAG